MQARYAGLWRLYVFAPVESTARAEAAAAELFGYRSERTARDGQSSLNRTDTDGAATR